MYTMIGSGWRARQSNAKKSQQIVKPHLRHVSTSYTESSLYHPLYTAVFVRKPGLASSTLRVSDADELSPEEWFVVLATAVINNMHDVALEILEKNMSLATTRNEQGTILHLLSQQDISGLTYLRRRRARSLAKKLWAEIQKLEPEDACVLLRNPPILNGPAKVGNVELITMLTRTYPELVMDKDSSGYTMFHVAVLYRQKAVFKLIHHLTDTSKGYIATSVDEEGNTNTILHLAAKLSPLSRRGEAFRVSEELMWFKEVEKIAATSYLFLQNRHGEQPRELFSKEHNHSICD